MVYDIVDGGQGCGAGQRVAAERSPMDARLDVVYVCADEHSSHRHATSHRLGQTHQIGAYAIVLASEQPARATKASLDLIQDEQGALFVTQFTHPAQVLWIRWDDPALSLHGFE